MLRTFLFTIFGGSLNIIFDFLYKRPPTKFWTLLTADTLINLVRLVIDHSLLQLKPEMTGKENAVEK